MRLLSFSGGEEYDRCQIKNLRCWTTIKLFERNLNSESCKKYNPYFYGESPQKTLHGQLTITYVQIFQLSQDHLRGYKGCVVLINSYRRANDSHCHWPVERSQTLGRDDFTLYEILGDK